MHLPVILGLLWCQCVLGLHFYLGGSDNEQCFFQDFQAGTVLAVKYSAWELEEKSGQWVRPDTLAIQLSIEETFDNDHRVLFQKLNAKGDVLFTAYDSGQHRLCFRALSNGWFHSSKVKMDIDFVIGDEHTMDSKNEKQLSSLAQRVRNLNARLIAIKREQKLMREREEQFRNSSESANSHVVRWTFIQLFVLGITCAWQLNHLRSFFVKQKLV